MAGAMIYLVQESFLICLPLQGIICGGSRISWELEQSSRLVQSGGMCCLWSGENRNAERAQYHADICAGLRDFFEAT